MKHILCIDPGEGTGWAKMDLRGTILEFDNLNSQEVFDRLNNYPDPENIAHLIYEEFIVRRGKAAKFAGNRMIVTRMIGAVQLFANKHNIKPVVQAPQCKDIGSKWSGMKPPSNHSVSHATDAYNHGFYFLRNTYNIPTALEKADWAKHG